MKRHVARLCSYTTLPATKNVRLRSCIVCALCRARPRARPPKQILCGSSLLLVRYNASSLLPSSTCTSCKSLWLARRAIRLRRCCAPQTQRAAARRVSRSGSRPGEAPGPRLRPAAVFCSRCKRRAPTEPPRGTKTCRRRRSACPCPWPARCLRCAQPRAAARFTMRATAERVRHRTLARRRAGRTRVRERQRVLLRDAGLALTPQPAAAAPQTAPTAFPPAGGLFRVRARRQRTQACLATPDSVCRTARRGLRRRIQLKRG